MVHPLRLDRFQTHDEITAILSTWADEFPQLVTLESLGTTRGDRPIWMLTISDPRSGPAHTKPAVLVDANIHAAELTSSVAALHLAQRLVTGHGTDEVVDAALDACTFLVIPRINPDGAELVLNEGRFLRSSVRPYPDSAPQPGLRQRDIDGDGRMLFMRVADPTGPWKRSPSDPRLLVRRGPADDDPNDAFRLLVEGDIVDWDGATVPAAPPLEGIDLAMNLPADYGAESTSPHRFGPHPGSEPEARALLEVVDTHPNIVASVSCHTFGGLHLHPPLNDDDDVPALDRQIFADLGDMAQQLTGYTAMSMHDLKFADGQRFHGGPFGWFYYHLGIIPWITEFWNPPGAAGLTVEHPSSWLLDHPESDDLALLRWNDEELDGQGFVEWYPFEHPQLGAVELGGWDIINAFYNPPLDRVEEEVAPHTEWVLALGRAMPRLELRSLDATLDATGLHRVRAVVANAGWLPTHGTAKARHRGTSGPVTVEVELPRGADLVAGDLRVDVGHLEGRVEARTSTTWWGHSAGTPDLALVEWVVHAPEGGTLSLHAHHPRAGSVHADVALQT